MKYNYYEKGFMFYLNGINAAKTSVCVRHGRLAVKSPISAIISPLKAFIESKIPSGAKLSNSVLETVLKQSSDLEFLNSIGKSPTKSKVDIDNVVILPSRTNSPLLDVETPQESGSGRDLFFESQRLDPRTIQFVNDDVLENLQFIIDRPREPEELVECLRRSHIPSDNIIETVQEFDIRVVSMDCLDELIIERKRVDDFNKSIKSGHLHDQVERYYDYMMRKNEAGINVRVLWIIEGIPSKRILPNEILDGLPQLDGWMNYQMMISDQFFHYTYSTNHTAYSVLKMAQGFFERELKFKTKSGLANRIKLQKAELNTKGKNDSGVYRAGINLKSQLMFIDGVPTNVAEELSKTGKSFAQIVQMSKEELLEIKGVGKKLADRIYNAFNVTE